MEHIPFVIINCLVAPILMNNINVRDLFAALCFEFVEHNPTNKIILNPKAWIFDIFWNLGLSCLTITTNISDIKLSNHDGWLISGSLQRNCQTFLESQSRFKFSVVQESIWFKSINVCRKTRFNRDRHVYKQATQKRFLIRVLIWKETIYDSCFFQ